MPEPNFSQRSGLKPFRLTMQVDDMDKNLRIDIWNAVMQHYVPIDGVHLRPNSATPITNFFSAIQTEFFNEPIDQMPDNTFQFQFKLKNAILDYLEWNQVYDLIEFLAHEFKKDDTNQEFMDDCNKILEKHNSVYRFVSGKIVKVVSEIEIKEIDMSMNSPFQEVNQYLARAWDLISGKINPDYQECINESINAVEFICQKILKNPVATLGGVIEMIAKEDEICLPVHPWETLEKIDGHPKTFSEIRSAVSNQKGLKEADARLMLVFCSSLVNYLISKTHRTNIKSI